MRGIIERVVVAVIVLTGGLAGSVSAVAAGEQAAPATSSALTLRSQRRGPAPDPYGTLFDAPAARTSLQRGQEPVRTLASEPRVVCGMTVMPVDPATDPEFARPTPDRSTSFTIRAVEPTVCAADAPR
jgi:hypothetical protein